MKKLTSLSLIAGLCLTGVANADLNNSDITYKVKVGLQLSSFDVKVDSSTLGKSDNVKGLTKSTFKPMVVLEMEVPMDKFSLIVGVSYGSLGIFDFTSTNKAKKQVPVKSKSNAISLYAGVSKDIYYKGNGAVYASAVAGVTSLKFNSDLDSGKNVSPYVQAGVGYKFNSNSFVELNVGYIINNSKAATEPKIIIDPVALLIGYSF